MAACWPSGGARIQSQEPQEFRGAQRMQNIRYATELLHVLRTGLVGRHRVEKLCNLILSFSWKSPAVRQTTLSSSAKWVSEGRQLVFLLHLLWNSDFSVHQWNAILLLIVSPFTNTFVKKHFFFWIYQFSSSVFGQGWLVLLSTEDFSM